MKTSEIRKEAMTFAKRDAAHPENLALRYVFSDEDWNGMDVQEKVFPTLQQAIACAVDGWYHLSATEKSRRDSRVELRVCELIDGEWHPEYTLPSGWIDADGLVIYWLNGKRVRPC